MGTVIVELWHTEIVFNVLPEKNQAISFTWNLSAGSQVIHMHAE